MKAPVSLDQLPELLSVEQLSDALGVSERNTYVALRKRQIPHRRVGSRYVIYREAIRQWLLCQPDQPSVP